MMINEVKTENIYLDTSIFVSENFLAGKKLQSLLKYENRNDINLYISEITIKECLKKIEEFGDLASSLLRKAIKDLEGKGKIFKNLSSLRHFYELRESFNHQEEIGELKSEFLQMIDSHFKIIVIDEKATEKIFNNYFEGTAPFGSEKKKHEFPDAFVMASIEKWCKEKEESIYLVSDDLDMSEHESNKVICINEFSSLLEQVAYTFSDKNKFKKVGWIIEKHEEEIKEEIHNLVVDSFTYHGYDSYSGFDYDVNDIEINSISIDKIDVMHFLENTGNVELEVTIDYTVNVTYEDTTTGYYDKDIERWYGAETVTDKVSDWKSIEVYLDVEVPLPGKLQTFDWQITDIEKLPDEIRLG